MTTVANIGVHPTADDLSHHLYSEVAGGWVSIGPLSLHFGDRATILAVVEELVKLHDAIDFVEQTTRRSVSGLT